MTKYFNPKPDITAYEFAVLFCNVAFHIDPMNPVAVPLQPIYFDQVTWDSLKPELQRHFDDVKPEMPIGKDLHRRAAPPAYNA